MSSSSGYHLNVKASEFTPLALSSPDFSNLNPHAFAFEPDLYQTVNPSKTEPKDTVLIDKLNHEIPEEVKTSQIAYPISFLLSLRSLCTSLPPDIHIPDSYSINSKKGRKIRKKGKTHKNNEIKRQDSVFTSCVLLIKTEKPLSEKLKREVSDLEKSSRRIRAILNKLSKENLEKLGNSLVEDFDYNYDLLQELVKFIFERATAQSFADVYANLCGFLTRKFKEKDEELSKGFKVKIVENCRESFYNEHEPLKECVLMDAEYKRKRRLIGNIKFIGLLFKQRMIKTDIMFECFDVLLRPESISDETIETCCHLFKESASLLAVRQVGKLNEYFDRIAELLDSQSLSKRLIFMIQDIIETKTKLMTPLQKVKSQSSASEESKITRKIGKVKFADEEEDKEVSASYGQKSILKMIVSDETKAELKDVVNHFLADTDFHKAVVKLKNIFGSNLDKSRQLIYQIVKYVICEYTHNSEFDCFCALLSNLLQNYPVLTPEIIETGLVLTIESLSDIQLDSPNASTELSHIIRELQAKGALKDDSHLLSLLTH